MKKLNIAILSPSQNAYSETFIQNHKKYLEGNIFYYYGGSVPTLLEGRGILKHSILDEFIFFLRRLIGRDISYSLLDSKTLIRSLKKNKIDIIYAEFGTTGADVIGICKDAKIPLVVNFHGVDAFLKSILSDYRYKYLELFNFAAKVIVVSQKMKAQLLALGCPEKNLSYIPNAPSEHFFDVQPQFTENSFISIGRFVDKKAPYYTILAFNKVLKKIPDAKLYMVGDGLLFETCQNLVKELDISDRVIFLGICEHNTILKYLSVVKAYVQHSITPLSGDMEGTPLAVLEASAASLPVISTRHAGISDVIIENETGFLVNEHDVESMAMYMIRILEEKDLAKKMGDAGRKNIKENFSLHQQINALDKIIANCFE